LIKSVKERTLRASTSKTVYLNTVFINDEGWDASDLLFSDQVFILISIYDFNIPTSTLKFMDNWFDRTTGTTPSSGVRLTPSCK
jgi:hypothetical protein